MTVDPRFQQSYGAEDGSILPWTTQSRLVKGASGGALAEEEEVLVGDTSKKVPPPTTIAELTGAYHRWGNTLIVANTSLDKPVLNPVHVLAYIDMLGYLASYPNMLYPQYASYVNENGRKFLSHQFTFLEPPIFLDLKMNLAATNLKPAFLSHQCLSALSPTTKPW
jgi:hypothetical protein